MATDHPQEDEGNADPSLEGLHCIAREAGSTPEAMQLILHVISRVSDYRELPREEGPDVRRHLSARELSRAVINCVGKNYGQRGRRLLRRWKLDCSEDLGAVVFALAGKGLVSTHPDDAPSDFDALYTPEDLDEEFADMSVADPSRGTEHEDEEGIQAEEPQGPARRKAIPSLLAAHFGREAITDLVITQREFPSRVRADLQKGLEAVLDGSDVHHFSGIRKRYEGPLEGMGFSSLIHYEDEDTAVAVPPEYEEVEIGEAEPVRCLKIGVWLIHREGFPMAVILSPLQTYHGVLLLRIQVAVPRSAAKTSADFFAALERAVRESQSYRGKILSLESGNGYSGRASGVHVHQLRMVSRDEVVLPDSTLELLERNVIRFVDQREKMRQHGVMLKKGVLFYGPPGTGKTHTIHYLARELKGHTTLIMSAEQVALLDEYMALARLLQPSVLVMEDVDLIARERTTMRGPCEEALLNKLLNEMDGLREDVEVLFILTTNRPQMLEPALASRPGRIDQAIEFPMPDEKGREKLVRLYARGIELDDAMVKRIARRTSGVSGAFIKELMRRSLQFAVERDDAGRVSVDDVDHAIEEMLFSGGSLNRALLGVDDSALAEHEDASDE